jgi:hypothetical protein
MQIRLMKALLARFALGTLVLCAIDTWQPAAAQQAAASPPQPPPRQSCRADIQKFCADVHPGSGHIGQCLLSHKSALSAPCRDSLARLEAQKSDKSEPGKPQ